MSGDGPGAGARPSPPTTDGPPPEPFVEDPSEPTRRSRLPAVVAACVAVLAFGSSAVLVVLRLDLVLHGREVPGRVVSVRERYDPLEDATVHDVSIRVPARPGRPIVVERQSSRPLREGETVAMLVSERPEEALLAEGLHPMGLPAALALLGVFHLGLALTLWGLARSAPRREAVRIRPGPRSLGR